MQIRLAQNDEASQIQALLRYDGFEVDDLDWSDIYPYWLVAWHDGKIVGCLQVCLGKPIGRLECLTLAPWLSSHRKGRILQDLVFAGLATLRASGAGAAASMVSFENRSLQRWVKRHGAARAYGGNIFVKLL